MHTTIYTEYSTNNPCISQYIQNTAHTTLIYHNIYRIQHQQPLYITIYTEYITNTLVYHNTEYSTNNPCISQYIQNTAPTTLVYQNIYRIRTTKVDGQQECGNLQFKKIIKNPQIIKSMRTS